MPPRPLRPVFSIQLLHYAIGNCPLGWILVAHSKAGLRAVILGDEPEALPGELRARFPQADLIPVDPAEDAYLRQVIGLIDAPQAAFEIALDIIGLPPPGVGTIHGDGGFIISAVSSRCRRR